MRILFFYIFKRFWLIFTALSFGFMMLIFLIDFIETSYRLSKRLEFSALDFVQISALKMPELYTEVLPFLVLFTSVAVYRRFISDSELDIFRSAGISAWQFLSPAIASACILGILNLLVLSDIAIKSSTMSEAITDQLRTQQSKTIDTEQVISSQVWLHDTIDGEFYTFDIMNIAPAKANLSVIKIQSMDIRVQNAQGEIQRQIQANNVIIDDARWVLKNPIIIDYTQNQKQQVSKLILDTHFSPKELAQSALSAEFLNFFQLLESIRTARQSGLNSDQYLLYALNRLSDIILFVALAMIGGTLALRHKRRGGGTLVLVSSISSGFLVWIFSAIMLTLGIDGKVPVFAAALLPAILALFVAILLILYREEG